MSGCGSRSPRQSETTESQPIAVRTARLEKQPSTSKTVVCYGKLVAKRETSLTFLREGEIFELFKDVGDTFTAGEPLAELRQESLNRQLAAVQTDWDAERERRLNNSGGQPSTPSPRELELESEFNRLSAEISRGTILAPYDCILAERFGSIGDVVQPGTRVLSVVENIAPKVVARIDAEIAAQVSTEQIIWVEAPGGLHAAVLAHRAPRVNVAGQQSVEFNLSDQSRELIEQVGSAVEIRFLLPVELSGYWLPLEALQAEPNGLWSVFFVDEKGQSKSLGRIEKRLVELIQVEEDSVYAFGDFEEDGLILIEGTHRVVPGQRVKFEVVDRSFIPAYLGEPEL